MRTLLLSSLCLLAACTNDGTGSVPQTVPTGPTGTPVDTGYAVTTATDPGPNPNTTGDSETCLLLYGGIDRVRGPDEGLPLDGDPRTMQAWVRTTNEGEQVAVSYGRPSPEQGFLLGTEGGYAVVRAGSGSARIVGDTFIADDDWHHLAAAFDGRLAVITVDGQTDGIGELNVATLEGDLVAGNTPTGDLDSPWIGWIDDVRIFDGARPPDEIADDLDGDTVSPSSLHLWWDFEITPDEAGPGVEVPDLSGNGHDGTTGGANETSPEFPRCR